MTAEGADERRIRAWLRGRGVGPSAPPPPPPPQAPPATGQAPDWWQTLYDGEGQQRHVTQPHESAPAVHITVTQPSPRDTSAQDRRTRYRRWLAYHGAAAGAGYGLGLGPMAADYLTDAGVSAVPAGLGVLLIASLPAWYVPGLAYIPPPLRPLTVWLSRIPASTIALALALHAPGTVI